MPNSTVSSRDVVHHHGERREIERHIIRKRAARRDGNTSRRASLNEFRVANTYKVRISDARISGMQSVAENPRYIRNVRDSRNQGSCRVQSDSHGTLSDTKHLPETVQEFAVSRQIKCPIISPRTMNIPVPQSLLFRVVELKEFRQWFLAYLTLQQFFRISRYRTNPRVAKRFLWEVEKTRGQVRTRVTPPQLEHVVQSMTSRLPRRKRRIR